MLISPEGSPFTFFGTMRLFLKEKNFQKFQIFFQNVLRFLSLRYGADVRRSRVVCRRFSCEKCPTLTVASF